MMDEKHKACYAAFKSKDYRFDGHFFVGVTSTGIYCRPVCRARLPKAENCIFFATAAEAEQAGFRPCLQCRPELAPGLAPIDALRTLARLAARLLEENCGNIENLEELAAHLGCTDRHLRRVFNEEYHVSPVEYLLTCRLLLAKSLLTDTKLSILDVAMTSGFGSLRRFNDVFKKQYHLAPTALRKQTAEHARHFEDNTTLTLGYRPPYEWDKLLSFFCMRAIPGVEVVRDGAYYRTVRLVAKGEKEAVGWIKVENTPKKNALNITVSASLLPVLLQVISRVKHMFDLNCDPNIIYETLCAMNELSPGLCVAGTRLPGCFDPFEMSVRAILGQQITVKAATTLAGRMAQNMGTPIQTGIDGLTHVFPSTTAIIKEPVSDKLGSSGIFAVRGNAIYALAKGLEDGIIMLSTVPDPKVTMEQLMKIPGIGAWTAGYIAMRALGWADAFLETDCGIQRALKSSTKKELLALAENWRPWRSYATINLWNSL